MDVTTLPVVKAGGTVGDTVWAGADGQTGKYSPAADLVQIIDSERVTVANVL